MQRETHNTYPQIRRVEFDTIFPRVWAPSHRVVELPEYSTCLLDILLLEVVRLPAVCENRAPALDEDQ